MELLLQTPNFLNSVKKYVDDGENLLYYKLN